MKQLPKPKRTPGVKSIGEILKEKKPLVSHYCETYEKRKDVVKTGDDVRDQFNWHSTAPEHVHKYKRYVNDNATNWLVACIQRDEEKLFDAFDALCEHVGWDLYSANLIFCNVIGALHDSANRQEHQQKQWALEAFSKYLEVKQEFIFEQWRKQDNRLS